MMGKLCEMHEIKMKLDFVMDYLMEMHNFAIRHGVISLSVDKKKYFLYV